MKLSLYSNHSSLFCIEILKHARPFADALSRFLLSLRAPGKSRLAFYGGAGEGKGKFSNCSSLRNTDNSLAYSNRPQSEVRYFSLGPPGWRPVVQVPGLSCAAHQGVHNQKARSEPWASQDLNQVIPCEVWVSQAVFKVLHCNICLTQVC